MSTYRYHIIALRSLLSSSLSSIRSTDSSTRSVLRCVFRRGAHVNVEKNKKKSKKVPAHGHDEQEPRGKNVRSDQAIEDGGDVLGELRRLAGLEVGRAEWRELHVHVCTTTTAAMKSVALVQGVLAPHWCATHRIEERCVQMLELCVSSVDSLPGVVGGARPHSALTPALTDVLPIFTNDEPHAVFTDPAPRKST